jgi:FkbM family methyltransferase
VDRHHSFCSSPRFGAAVAFSLSHQAALVNRLFSKATNQFMKLAFLKHLASTMPGSWQREMKRHLYRRQILRDSFITGEPDYALLSEFLSPGDWAIDVGANIGHYTKRMSDLVGERGRVIAFEPVGDTFSLLAANVQHYRYQNVTLINAAASDEARVAGMSVPRFANGLNNYYEASLTESTDGLQVLTFSIDSLSLPYTVGLVKIDAEEHELSILEGMAQLLYRDHPILIIEVSSDEVHSFLAQRGYSKETLPGSSNHIYRVH